MEQKKEICDRLPHDGAMCLLDEVIRWDHEGLLCLTHSHLASANPLRWEGMLSMVHAIEYAGQATALHNALCNPEGRAQSRLLAAIKDVSLTNRRMDEFTQPLQIEVRLIAALDVHAIYDFTVACSDVALSSGRLIVAGIPA